MLFMFLWWNKNARRGHRIAGHFGSLHGTCTESMPARNLVGPRVREARYRHLPRLTQLQLAARLQVAGYPLDQVAVAKIEIGLREVTDIELVGLAAALRVSAGWLLGEPGAWPRETQSQRKAPSPRPTT